MGISRSENMARIRGQDTGPERLLLDALTAAGLSVLSQVKTPAGRADAVIQGCRVVVFIDGCFWHGCPEHYVRPGSREDYWAERLRVNVARDRRQTLALEAEGWTVVRVWEHEVFTDLEGVTGRVCAAMTAETPAAPSVAWRVDRVDVLDPVARLERRCLVDLRNPELRQENEGRRCTTKWHPSRSRGTLV